MRYKSAIKNDEIVDYITKCSMKDNYSPTVREIAKYIGLSSTSVQQRINFLISNKKLYKIEGSRGYRVNKTIMPNKLVPLICESNSDIPIDTSDNWQCYLSLPEAIVGNGEVFVTKVKNAICSNNKISVGDYVLVQKQGIANENDVIYVSTQGKLSFEKYSSCLISSKCLSDYAQHEIIGVAVGIIKVC